MNPREQINRVSELMAVLDQKLAEVESLVRQADDLGASVPNAVLTGNQQAGEWWSFKSEQVLKRLEREDLIASALNKLTQAEREALKV